MKKYNLPYTLIHNLKIAFADDFKYTGIVQNKFVGKFNYGKDWFSMNEIASTAKIAITDDGTNNNLCAVSLVFRVSFENIDNQNQLDLFIARPLIAKYTTGSRQEKVSGSKSYPLYMSRSIPSDFDGYECTLTGTGIGLDTFI